MQIVFMNRLSRPLGPEEEAHAQLWIGEEEGVWRLGWRGISDSRAMQAGELADDLWYEGTSWNEMLCVYRHELAVKMGDGFRPLIEGVFHEEEGGGSRSQEQLKLQYYSEQHPNEPVYDELCTWRRGKASSERKAPYLLASNRLLRLLSTYLPRTLEELVQIPGVGEGKASQHGVEWLQITAAADRERDFPLSWVHEAVEEEEFISWLYRQKELKYKKQLERLRLRRILLQGIESGLGLEALKTQSGVTRRELIEAVEELEKEGYDVERLIQVELEAMTLDEQEKVWNAYGELGDSFLKPVLHKVYGEDFAAPEGLDFYYERLRLIRIRYRRGLGPALGAASSM